VKRFLLSSELGDQCSEVVADDVPTALRQRLYVTQEASFVAPSSGARTGPIARSTVDLLSTCVSAALSATDQMSEGGRLAFNAHNAAVQPTHLPVTAEERPMARHHIEAERFLLAVMTNECGSPRMRRPLRGDAPGQVWAAVKCNDQASVDHQV
jgi:hypothetical protein